MTLFIYIFFFKILLANSVWNKLMIFFYFSFYFFYFYFILFFFILFIYLFIFFFVAFNRKTGFDVMIFLNLKYFPNIYPTS